MKRITIAILVAASLLFAVLTVLAETGNESTGGDYALGQPAISPMPIGTMSMHGGDYAMQAGLLPNAASLAATSVITTEFWRLGVTSEGGASYAATRGRPVHPAATFRSNRGATDIYHIFAAPGGRRVVQAAKFYILDRTGAYADSATLTLEILDFDGTAQHAVSAAGIDVQAASAGVWIHVTLSGDSADLEIMPGEFLAFHFDLNGAPAGDLAAHLVFEVEVLNPPGPPTLLAPPDGTITTAHAITLAWQAGIGGTPTGYHVDVDGAIFTVTGATSPTILSTGVHTWTVRAFNSAGPSEWAAPWTVEVADTLPPPEIPTLLAPPDGLITTTQAVTLAWQAEAGAAPTGYHVDVDGAVVTVTGTISPTVLSTGVHTWTVQAFNSGGESPWATSWTVEITDTLPPPNVPTLLAPPNGTVTTTQAILLAWQAAAGAAPTGYRVDVDGTVVTVTGATSPTILSLGVHTWTVQAFNSSGSSGWAVPWTIEIAAPLPGVPTLLAPPDGLITITHAISLAWQAGAGAAPTGYHVDVDGTIVTVTGTTSPTVLSLGVHAWTVRAFNSGGESPWATPWTVEITDTLPPPGVPTLLAPPNGTIATTQAITFAWQAAAGAAPTGYRVDVDGAVVTVTNTTSPTILSNGVHTWTVQAFNSAGSSGWAAPWTVEVVEPPPGVPTLLAPPDGTFTSTRAITLVWQAGVGSTPTGYRVDVDGAVVTVTGTTSPTILSIGVHTWTVQAFNSTGSSGWAAPWMIEVTWHRIALPLVMRNFGP